MTGGYGLCNSKVELIHAEKSYAGPGIIGQTKSKTFMTGGSALRAQLPT